MKPSCLLAHGIRAAIAKHLRRGRQEDSHEFLRYAIDGMQKACLSGHSPCVGRLYVLQLLTSH